MILKHYDQNRTVRKNVKTPTPVLSWTGNQRLRGTSNGARVPHGLQEFLNTFVQAYLAETGKSLPLKPNDPQLELLHMFAHKAAQSLRVGTEISIL
jgi:hypothetical protein